jgi:hypothetical protein
MRMSLSLFVVDHPIADYAHSHVTCGESVADAWYLMYSFMRACEIQRDACAAAMSADNLLIPLEGMYQSTVDPMLASPLPSSLLSITSCQSKAIQFISTSLICLL